MVQSRTRGTIAKRRTLNSRSVEKTVFRNMEGGEQEKEQLGGTNDGKCLERIEY